MVSDRPNKTPYTAEWLAFEEATGGRFCCSGTADDIRQQFDGLLGQLESTLPPPRDDVKTEDYRTKEGVTVRAYMPQGAGGDLPIGIYIHSGGWISGSVSAENHLASYLAATVPCVLVSPDYRLAPENPFPAALDDCVSAYHWAVEEARRLGDDASRIFTVGGSAGGNLSLATALKIIETAPGHNDIPKPCGIFTLCPSVCMAQAVHDLPKDLQAFEKPDAYGDAAMIGKEAIKSACGTLQVVL